MIATKAYGWIRVKTNLHDDVGVWGLSEKAELMLYRLMHMPNREEDLPVGYVLARTRSDQTAMDEAVAAGVLGIVNGTVTLSPSVMPTFTPEQKRQATFRAKGKATPTAPTTDAAPTPEPQPQPSSPETEPQPLPTITQAPALQPPAMEDLIFPEQVTQAEQPAMRSLLACLQIDQAQAVLDEMAGYIFNGKTISNRIGWVRTLTTRTVKGAFIPELGVAIAERHRIITTPLPIPDHSPPPPPLDETLARVTDPTLKAVMERIRNNHFNLKEAA
ncbi:MAG: hypothetical protein HQL95_08175 [Magnetococcales bacterium]|nr:hypothetical protein [Magnetococcales bacterium]